MWGDLSRKPESKPNSDFDQMAGVALVGAVALGVLLFVAKYIPIVLSGAAFGFWIATARYQATLFGQIKTVVRNITFVALIFFIGLGLPIQPYKSSWAGALFYSKDFWNLCVDIARQWNGLVPNIKIFRTLVLQEISPLMVSGYVWKSLYAGLGFAVLFLILSLFGKLKSEISELRLKAVSVPAFLFSKLEGLIFGYWIRLGGFLKKESWIILLGAASILAWMGYGLQTSLVPRLYVFELRWLTYYLAYVPLLSLGLGAAFSLFSGGSSWIESLFAKEGAKLKDQPGFYIGKTFQGRPYRLTERNLGYHVEIIAPTGSGKTNLLKGLILDRIQKGHGVIFLDFKAEFEIVSWIYRVARSRNRENELRLFSLSNRDLSVPYNPLKSGDATDIQSALMNSMTWSESFYRGVASVALGTLIRSLCEYRDRTGEKFHLGHVYELLEQPGLMRTLADRMFTFGCPSAPKLSELAARIEKPSERSNLMGLISNLNQILFSSAGDLLSTDVTKGSFDFREAISQSRIAVMLMNSLKLKESAEVIGKIILQDLMSFVGDHYAQVAPQKHKPITLIVDEFASFAMPNFIEFMDRARGAGIGIVVAHQARADLRAVSPEFQERVEANSNTTLVSGLKSSEDAEYYAGMLGTKTTQKETIQKKQGLFWDESTGMKSVRDVEEFVVHPNKLRELSQGQVFAISKTIDPQWGLVNVAKAPELDSQGVDPDELLSHLKTIRIQYQNQKEDHYLDLKSLSPQPGLRAQIPESTPHINQETWN